MPPINRHVTLVSDDAGHRAVQKAHDKVHALTEVEAAVLRRCDGQTLLSEVAGELPPDTTLDEILASFGEKHLLTAGFMPFRYPSESQQLGDETLVYVYETANVHLLQPLAARIYAACDGRPVQEMEEEVGDDALWQALEELSSNELVPKGHPTRRRVLKTVAALPLVLSQLVPSASAAASACIMETFDECNATVQDPPMTCTPCCNNGGGSCGTSCATNCTSCWCLGRRTCSGGDCTTPGQFCHNDTSSGVGRCFEDGTNPICVFGAFNPCRKNCDAARADAASGGAANYRCCEGCS
ncbi:MAG: hypothetical protein AB7S38_12920 [Vulcanimicrobiota bacterium]